MAHMLQDEIIEESTSPSSSPIIVVTMPDGSLWLCNNFRKLNKVMECSSYPLPRVDKLINQLGRVQLISTLDLTNRTLVVQ